MAALLSGLGVPTGPHASNEFPPPGGLDGQHRAMRVFGVADGDDAGEVAGDLDAISTAVAAVAGLAPAPL